MYCIYSTKVRINGKNAMFAGKNNKRIKLSGNTDTAKKYKNLKNATKIAEALGKCFFVGEMVQSFTNINFYTYE